MVSVELKENTALLIAEKFNVAQDYADRLAIAALNGIDSKGGDPTDWETIEAVVNVVVKSWVEHGHLKENHPG
jgi:hypothetical protein